VLIGVALAAVLALGLLARGGEDPYTVKLTLDDAGGLQNGSPVTVGGLEIGTVDLQVQRDHVDVRLEIEKKHAPIGRDATAAIVAQNLLGHKQVRLTLGDRRGRPAPDGFELPSARVRPTTDLDQLLNTLDPDTRTRLAIALNEAGQALTGRRMDLSAALRDFAPAMRHGTKLLDQLTADDRALGNLVSASDSLIGTFAADRKGIGDALDQLGETTVTVSARRHALRATLRNAPGALRSARAFLTELRTTAAPLGATARQLRTTTPVLRTALQRLPEFQHAATPVLGTAVETAPALTKLGKQATPVLREAAPVLSDVEALSKETVPGVGRTLDRSIDNVLAILENWSRAIQFSDGLSHVFRGEASFAPDFIDSAVKRLLRGSNKRRQRKTASRPGSAPASAPDREQRPSPAPRPTAPKVPKLLEDLIEPVPDALEPLKKELLGVLSGGQREDESVESLLDYLLGASR